MSKTYQGFEFQRSHADKSTIVLIIASFHSVYSIIFVCPYDIENCFQFSVFKIKFKKPTYIAKQCVVCYIWLFVCNIRDSIIWWRLLAAILFVHDKIECNVLLSYVYNVDSDITTILHYGISTQTIDSHKPHTQNLIVNLIVNIADSIFHVLFPSSDSFHIISYRHNTQKHTHTHGCVWRGR